MKFVETQTGELVNVERIDLIRVASNETGEIPPQAKRFWIEGSGPAGNYVFGPSRATKQEAVTDLGRLTADLRKANDVIVKLS